MSAARRAKPPLTTGWCSIWAAETLRNWMHPLATVGPGPQEVADGKQSVEKGPHLGSPELAWCIIYKIWIFLLSWSSNHLYAKYIQSTVCLEFKKEQSSVTSQIPKKPQQRSRYLKNKTTDREFSMCGQQRFHLDMIYHNNNNNNNNNDNVW